MSPDISRQERRQAVHFFRVMSSEKILSLWPLQCACVVLGRSPQFPHSQHLTWELKTANLTRQRHCHTGVSLDRGFVARLQCLELSQMSEISHSGFLLVSGLFFPLTPVSVETCLPSCHASNQKGLLSQPRAPKSLMSLQQGSGCMSALTVLE